VTNETETRCSTHVLVPRVLVGRLRLLSRETRVPQNAYLEEAVDDMLAHFEKESSRSFQVPPPVNGQLESVVFRLEKRAMAQLKALVLRSRVPQSQYLREAVHALLVKYESRNREARLWAAG
jgi:predicted DNA-binding protein